MSIAISVEKLSKSYQLGLTHAGSIREVINGLVSSRRSKSPRTGEPSEKEFWALRDVSLDIAAGDVVGFIGPNGAGKSTLLKILSRITAPTAGRAVLRGRVAALLEVGTGFHPELTGRENVYLNGTMLGMTKAEVARQFDEIVDFSGVEAFIDTPVKRYSSGMTVRLGFAVAAHLKPEIMIVDEVLAVGDAAFQAKCMGKMSSLGSEGRTILFVSHNMAAIEKLTRKSFVLENGRVTFEGPSAEAVSSYLERTSSGGTTSGDMTNRPRVSWAGDRAVEIVHAELLSSASISPDALPFRLRIVVRANRSEKIVSFGVTLMHRVGDPIGCAHGLSVGSVVGGCTQAFDLTISDPGLAPGRYHFVVAVFRDNHEIMDVVHDVLHFDLTELGRLPEGWLTWSPGWGQINLQMNAVSLADDGTA